jgi:hypothetical protein
VIWSSEKSVYTISTRRRISDDGILRSHRRENLKTYKLLEICLKLRILDCIKQEFTVRCIIVWCSLMQVASLIIGSKGSTLLCALTPQNISFESPHGNESSGIWSGDLGGQDTGLALLTWPCGDAQSCWRNILSLAYHFIYEMNTLLRVSKQTYRTQLLAYYGRRTSLVDAIVDWHISYYIFRSSSWTPWYRQWNVFLLHIFITASPKSSSLSTPF